MANGASVLTVYTALQDLVNKDQQGFITPSVFNNFAQVAQLNIFNSFFDTLKDSKRNERANFNPGRDKSLTKRTLEDLSYFSKKATVPKASSVFAKPSNLSRIISASTAGSILLDISTKKPIELCYDEEKIERILISNLSSPTEEFPIALVSDDIYVFPTSINKIEIRYYRYPGSRNSSGVVSDSPPQIRTSALADRDFDLPEHYVSDLVMEIGKLAGVNLRDKDVVDYTSQDVVSKTQAQNY